jgi:NAD(P)-dependent dehydrogenase (short-subunit alcohol dehydrogenase family)
MAASVLLIAAGAGPLGGPEGRLFVGHERLVGRRILLIGGSAGIGPVIGKSLCAAGAHVAFAARRRALCQQMANEANGLAIGLGCDVTDESQCYRAVEEAVEGLGGLDDLVYSTGLISIVALADAGADLWRRTLETNVMGASLITRAALPHLQRSAGTAVYLSSVSSRGGPWPGLGLYTASKTALNRMIETWRSEHPEVGFARILVGPTADGANGAEFHPGAGPHMARHGVMGLTSGVLSPPVSVASAVMWVLGEEASRIWDVTVQPKDPPLPWPEPPSLDDPPEESG